MKPQPAERLPTAPGWKFEPEYDGYRASITTQDGTARLVSRRGTDLTPLFPDLAAAVVDQVPAGTQLDGELVIYQQGRLSFDALQQRMAAGARHARIHGRSAPATLMAFDVLVDQGTDLTGEPWSRWRERIELMATSWRPPVQLTPYTDNVEEAAGWMETLAPMGIEGVVAKRASARYGVPRSWVKVKHRQSLEGLVGAVVGPLQHPEALVVGYWAEDGTLSILGRAPLTPREGHQVGPLLQPPTGPHPWPEQISAAHFGGDPVTITHTDPTVVVEVLADTAESGGRRRHPLRFVRVRLN